MYKIKVDTHTHSVFSKHAYSTVYENMIAAKKMNLDAMVLTDHFGYIFAPGGNLLDLGMHFTNPDVLPKNYEGFSVFSGVEIDIVNTNGGLAGENDEVIFFGRKMGDKSVSDYILDHCEVVIASVHYIDGMEKFTETESTDLYVNVSKNKKVNILGHIGRSGLPFHVPTVVKAAKENNTVIEINNSSIKKSFFNSEKSLARCTEVLLECKKQNAFITVSSDAHCFSDIGVVDDVIDLLKKVDFPEELIVNASMEKFKEVFNL